MLVSDGRRRGRWDTAKIAKVVVKEWAVINLAVLGVKRWRRCRRRRRRNGK
jgi:hypothetical protein